MEADVAGRRHIRDAPPQAETTGAAARPVPREGVATRPTVDALQRRPAREGRPRAPYHGHGDSSVRCDVVIDMSDGLTVPFALAAGLAGAVQLPLLA